MVKSKMVFQNINRIYDYILSENKNLNYLRFSINKNNIYLSYIIIDSTLTFKEGKLAINRLIELSNKYDNILINNFNAIKIKIDEEE